MCPGMEATRDCGRGRAAPQEFGGIPGGGKSHHGAAGGKNGIDILTAGDFLPSVMLFSEAIHISIIGGIIIPCRRPGHGDMA